MMNIAQLTTFFGWCSVINFAVLLFASIAVVLLKDWVMAIHSRWFDLPKETLGAIYMKYLAYYKIGILLFNVAPYVALKIMHA